MRVAIASDLHVEHQLDVVGAVASHLQQVQPDVTLLLGDVCTDLDRLGRSLRILVEAIPGPLLFLPGNHEVWCADDRGPDSRERWETVIPRQVRRAGAVPLGHVPVSVGPFVFVGVTGWFDGSLVDRPLEAANLVGVRDARQVRWPGLRPENEFHEDLSAIFAEALAGQCRDAAGTGKGLVAVTHMVPARAIVTAIRGSAGMDSRRVPTLGSQRLWDVLSAQEALVLAACGHLHVSWQGSLPGVNGLVPFRIAALGYPRERTGSLREHVAKRVAVHFLEPR